MKAAKIEQAEVIGRANDFKPYWPSDFQIIMVYFPVPATGWQGL